MEKIAAKGWLIICSFFLLLSSAVFLNGCGKTSNIAGNWFIYDATNGFPGEQGPNLLISRLRPIASGGQPHKARKLQARSAG